jgi:hypothetical protein
MNGVLDIETSEDIEGILSTAGLTKGLSSSYVEVCPQGTFRTALDWRSRAHSEAMGKVEVLFPHPIDILVSKISREEEKDYEAFEEVIAKTSHPTEGELLESLICAVHLYRPGYDETVAGDPITKTRLLWQRIFDRNIDVRQKIIAAASK